MKVLTPEEMRKCDEHTINKIGIPSLVLMERAAHSVCTSLYNHLKHVPENALILCGSGNNGGDGLAMARELSDLGCRCDIAPLMGFSKFSKDAATELNLLKDSGCNILDVNQLLISLVNPYEVIVDAIFGTGLNRNIPERMDLLLKKINNLKAYKVAVDIPTGIDAETGQLYADNPFKANLTVTFAFPKSGLLYYPAREFIGQMICTYIGIRQETPDHINWKPKKLLTKEKVSEMMPVRKKDGHKGTFGKLCVIGGSETYKGAPALTMQAALRTGIGLIKGILPNYKSSPPFYSPEMILEDNNAQQHHSLLNYHKILEKAEENDAVVIGPGLGRKESTMEFVRTFISDFSKPVLIDADALFAISGEQTIDLLNSRKAATILTPHMMEFSRLIGKSLQDIRSNRINILRDFAARTNTTIVLKDATTTIASNGNLFINATGNNGLATGGSGDVLSGIIGTFLAQGLSCEKAAAIGTYIHGLTADMYTRKNYGGSLLPSDICVLIPQALQELTR